MSANALGRNKVLRMKAKRNRYDLSLFDVRKLSLYGRAMESVQVEQFAGIRKHTGPPPNLDPSEVEGFTTTQFSTF
jgi:hypothetical protein